MIEVPAAPAVATSTTTTPTMVDGMEEWPSLAASPAQPRPATNATTGGEGDDWEMLSPAESNAADDNEGDSSVVIVKPPHPLQLARKNSISAPDLRELEDVAAAEDEEAATGDGDDDVSSSVVMVSNPGSTAGSSANNVWKIKNKVSFRDAILSPSKHAATIAAAKHSGHLPRSMAGMKKKVKSRYVVTPIKRCAKSTGDLLSLAEQEAEEDDGPMGASDAMEYYQRKQHGERGRSNGLKLRPDEAKRKEMIVSKKNLQREKQGK